VEAPGQLPSPPPALNLALPVTFLLRLKVAHDYSAAIQKFAIFRWRLPYVIAQICQVNRHGPR